MSLEVFRLTGKNALVTGSRRGLGAAIAVALARAGANVGCHGHDKNPVAGRHMLERGAGGKILNIASLLSFQGGFCCQPTLQRKGVLLS